MIGSIYRLKQGKMLAGVACREIRDKYLGRFLPVPPRVLNLLVTDVCDSACRMCHVWKNQQGMELNADELTGILLDPLFARLTYVGVSGGEPTLRKDLPDLYEAIVRAHPKLKGVGIITNAINEHNVINRIEASARICRKARIPFNVMVSLDGLGVVHDKIRGRKGNYESALSVIRHFQDRTDISVAAGCTVIKENVWHIDEVYDFCRQEKISAIFRVGEFIRRLDNLSLTGSIRNFDDDETYHLGLFFARLEKHEVSLGKRRVYGNIRKMLLDSSPRTIGCLWQSRAVTLDCQGRLYYCAPRSPALGNGLSVPVKTLYRKNRGIRNSIIQNDCRRCIHDYPAEPDMKYYIGLAREKYWKRYYSLPRALSKTRHVSRKTVWISAAGMAEAVRRYLVIGWYGTETAGDKAILKGIVNHLKEISPEAGITVASMVPDYTRWTVKEIDCRDVEVIPLYSRRFVKEIDRCDEMIMGGGPLMHLETLGFVLRAFARGHDKGKKTRIMGCGIGPLSKGLYYIEAVTRILLLSDTVELRDEHSAQWARKHTGRTDIAVIDDYAVRFVKEWLTNNNAQPVPRGCLSLYLRELTTEYRGEETADSFADLKSRFEEQLGCWIRDLCVRLDLRPRLLPMHHFYLGNDDREFNRKFASEYLQDLHPVVENRPVPVTGLLQSMRESNLCICMRFHSVLFANELNVPFHAVDYTRGGKIYHYLQDRNRTDTMLDMAEIAAGRWKEALIR